MLNRKQTVWILALGVIATVLAACAAPAAAPTATSAPTAAPASTVAVARPSNPGGPGSAIKLTGDAKAGADVYVANCKKCHGDTGTGGVTNPGSNDGTVPGLNPIDDTLKSSDPVVYATNLDLFIEHGSMPAMKYEKRPSRRGGGSPDLGGVREVLQVSSATDGNQRN